MLTTPSDINNNPIAVIGHQGTFQSIDDHQRNTLTNSAPSPHMNNMSQMMVNRSNDNIVGNHPVASNNNLSPGCTPVNHGYHTVEYARSQSISPMSATRCDGSSPVIGEIQSPGQNKLTTLSPVVLSKAEISGPEPHITNLDEVKEEHLN